MGTMAPGSAKFVGSYGGLPMSFGPKDDLLVLTVEDCDYYVSVTESKDNDGDGSPDCLGASGVSKDTVTVADAKAAATAITVGVAVPIVISVAASVTAALVGGVTAAAGGAASSSAAGGALGPLIMQVKGYGVIFHSHAMISRVFICTYSSTCCWLGVNSAHPSVLAGPVPWARGRSWGQEQPSWTGHSSL
jgi:hypothetical protein